MRWISNQAQPGRRRIGPDTSACFRATRARHADIERHAVKNLDRQTGRCGISRVSFDSLSAIALEQCDGELAIHSLVVDDQDTFHAINSGCRRKMRDLS